ncbi:unnamed protein product [Prorocentrum cordatum]|uniref:Uncharacterized protein n=1 Tax=Prorocentrum cordatum TaxID=2364126 RepID=A0ABN9UML0_9DINO|nr:unnamed protein product [Polarella glacialis]
MSSTSTATTITATTTPTSTVITDAHTTTTDTTTGTATQVPGAAGEASAAFALSGTLLASFGGAAVGLVAGFGTCTCHRYRRRQRKRRQRLAEEAEFLECHDGEEITTRFEVEGGKMYMSICSHVTSLDWLPPVTTSTLHGHIRNQHGRQATIQTRKLPDLVRMCEKAGVRHTLPTSFGRNQQRLAEEEKEAAEEEVPHVPSSRSCQWASNA